MATKIEALREEALSLADSERAELAAELLESLEPGPDQDVEMAWREEVRRRLEATADGSSVGTPWAVVRDRLWARLREQR